MTTNNGQGALLAGALKKIEETDVPELKKIAIAFSGGLDSTLCIVLAREKYGAEVVPITVDVGQGQQEIDQAFSKAQELGITPLLIDAKDEFANEWLTKAIQANSDYNGYPVSTSMTRQLIAAKVAEKAAELGCDALMEGSSGRGNDQYRMHNVFSIFAPDLKILVPVRDFDLTRQEELALCEHYGVPVTEIISGGDDKTLWCRSIASGGIGLDTELPDEIWMWLTPPQKAPDEPTTITLTFENGLPVALNGQQLSLPALIEQLNEIAGANGIGKIDIFEDGIMDLKSREIYEAPGAKVILAVHKDMESATLTKQQLTFKKMVDSQWASLVYHGEWFQPLKADLDAFIASTQAVVQGTWTVSLYKGNIEIIKRESPAMLFKPEIRSIAGSGFNQQLCGPAAYIRGLPFQIIALRDADVAKANGVGELVSAD
ncbi:MAG TPA: argininosuccinate synthase [Thermomicrobiales bacterium]|nr:argininosuccinate synthase [Thermomicrobiales bacterium]